MSDFLLCSAPRPPGVLRGALAAFLDPVTAAYREWHGPWGSLAVALAPHDGEVVVEDGRGLSVLIGAPIVRVPGAEAGRAGVGTLRAAVHALLLGDDGVAWDERLDGPFVAVGIDPARGGGRVVVDLMGSIPVFGAPGPDGGGVVVGTHVDAVARAAGRATEPDAVSLVDLLANLSVTFPYTAYAGVRQWAPAAEHRWEAGRAEPAAVRPYWLPEEGRAHASPGEAARALREGVVENVRAAVRGAPRVGMLLSAGEDSRVVAGAVPRGTEVRGFVFADLENREVRIARRIARAYGVELAFGRREPDHYLGALEPVASLVGTQQLFTDVHGYGFHRSLGMQALPLVLGGFSADSLLKGNYAPAPEHRAAPPRQRGVVPGLRAELLAAALERRRGRWEEMRRIRPGSASEWVHLWPFSMRKHAANLHGNRRLFRSHEPFHGNAVLKLAAGVPLEWKLGRRLFRAAMRPLLARSWYIPHGKPRFPYFGPLANAPLAAGVAAARAVGSLLTGTLGANHGPWPRMDAMVRSEAMALRLDRYLRPESPLHELFEPARRGRTAEELRAGWSARSQLLLLQLAFLLPPPE